MTDGAVVERPLDDGTSAVDTGPRITSGEVLALRATGGALSGFILSLAFPSVGWWPLAPVAVAGFCGVLRGAGVRSGALIGFAFGLSFFLPHLSWSGIYVGSLPWIALAVLEALFLAVLGAVLPFAWRAPGGPAGMATAVAGSWILQEAVRSRFPFGGFPWGRLAFSQAESPAAGLAALGGMPLVSSAVAASGALLAWSFVALATARNTRRTADGPPSRRALAGAAATLVAAVALPVLGAAVPRPADAPRSARIAAIQGNVPRAGLEFNAERRAVLDNHVAATLALGRRTAAGAEPPPDVVIWPENASDIDPLRNPDAAQVIDRAVAAVDVPVLVGAVLREPAGALSNATLVWEPGSGPGERYVKQHPAPFGEYIPWRGFFRMVSDKVDLVRTDFVAGDRIGLLRAGPVLAADVICFEVAYDGLVREPVRQGADLIVVQTNNATFGRSDESVQQLAMSQLRAIENGRSVVHISTVGISALIAPDGRILERSGHFEQDVLSAGLPLRTHLTVATRVGAWPEWCLGALGALLLLAGALRGRAPAQPGGTTPATTGTPETGGAGEL